MSRIIKVRRFEGLEAREYFTFRVDGAFYKKVDECHYERADGTGRVGKSPPDRIVYQEQLNAIIFEGVNLDELR